MRNCTGCLEAAGNRHGLECTVCQGEYQDVWQEADLRARNSTKALGFEQREPLVIYMKVTGKLQHII